MTAHRPLLLSRTLLQLPLALALGLLAPRLSSDAAMIAYDGFNSYSVGDLSGNNGGAGWNSAWSSFTAANDVVAGGLSYSAGSLNINGGANTMQKSSGAGGVNADPYFNRSFSSTSSSSIWMSFLFQSGNLSGTDFLEFYLSDAAGEGNSGAALVNFGASGANKLGVRANPTLTSGALSSYGGGTPGAGTTYLLVTRISGDGSGSATNYDRVEFWLNPTSTSLGAATASVDLDLEVSSLAYFGVRANGLASTDIFKVDELKIGTTAVDVVPEPNSIALVGLGFLGFILLRRQNRLSVRA